MFAADLIPYSEDFGEDGNLLVQATAVDTTLDNTVFRFADTLLEGRFAENGKNELVIGSWIAEDRQAEAGGIGLPGSSIGMAFGMLAYVYIVQEGLDFGFFMREMDMAYRVQSIFRGTWSLKSILTTFISGIFLSMPVAWIPTRRAIEMDIPSCPGHQ